MNARRLALAALAAGSASVLVLGFVPGPAAATVLTALAAVLPFALMALGASRGGRLGRAAVPIGLALLLVEGAMLGMLALRGRVLDGPWLAGLPLGAALQLLGIFLLPLVVIALGFAFTFRRLQVDERDLERLRRLGAGGDS